MAEQKKTKQGAGTMKGRVHEVTPLEHVGAKRHPKRSLVLAINEDDKYPQNVPIEFFGEDKVALLAEIGCDDEVTVSFDLRGREGGGRWYSSVNGWKVEVNERAAAPVPNGSAGNDDEGLPF
jgi:hypothetical protein